ncbi:hypothetical protein X474_09120 [Dethiosulfatarculus sandiegensis]|uniref:SPOR domain-containing protein n=1 Tax=Dethiosulfatarculus sandiegensis TaxID=1429043 RepID=A0A0D2JF91_9BACT|nr:hypothetical protein X474_09120 [Dethiosulfatarculus sandiegensis]
MFSIFLICWAFVLGIWVGQGKLATEEQLALWQSWMGKQNKPVKTAGTEPLPPRTLSFYDGVAAGTPPKKETTKPVKKPSSEKQNKGQYTVQVASMKEPAQALSLARKLKEAGHPAYIKKTMVKGVGLRYRVRVGPFDTLDLAQSSVARMKHKYKFAAFITRKEK